MGKRRSGPVLVLAAMVLSTLALVVLPVTPAVAAPAPAPPPPGPVNGTANFEGTEAVLDEAFGGAPCYFHNTKTIFSLNGAGTFAGVTAGAAPVAYTTSIGGTQTLHADGPVHIEVESTSDYYHGPSGTFGTDPTHCDTAHLGSAVPAVVRLFAPDHLYKLSGGAQVPCTGTGSFYRYGGDWHADWTLDADCVVVGNAAGTPGTGAAPRGSLFTDDGQHAPCSDTCTSNIGFDAKEYLAIRGWGATLVGSTASAQVGDTVTATARITNDGVAQAGTTVSFSVAGPGTATPPSGSATTGADGRATFSFTTSVVGSYTVTASATNTSPPQTATANLTVQFTPPDPPTVVLTGPTTAPTEEPVTLTAHFTDARVPKPGATVNFSVAATAQITPAGTATPPSGSPVTDANGDASFSFTGSRAGTYTVTATIHYNGADYSANRAVALAINTFYRAGGATAGSGESRLNAAVIEPTSHYGYFGTDTNPASVVKFNLTTMARVGAVTLNTGEANLRSAVIDPAGHYGYFGTNANPAQVVKVDLTTMTRVGAITLASGEGNLGAAVIDPAGAFAYFGTAVSGAPGKVVKIDLSSFTRVGAITFPSEETQVRAAVVAPNGATAYFAATGGGDNAARLVKVDLATFTRVGAAELFGPDESTVTSAVIDPAGHFAYLGTDAFPAYVVKMDLTTLTRVAALRVDGYQGQQRANLFSAVMAADGAHAYFSTSSTSPSIPGQVVEVDLGSFTRARTVTLPTTDLEPASAVVEADGSYAYFGTGIYQGVDTSPGHVVKVALNRPPKAALAAGNDSYSTPYAVPLTVGTPGVLANDADTGDGDPIVATQASDPAHGSVTVNANGSFTYTADPQFSGTDTFTYTASDGMDFSAPATVTVGVGVAPGGVSDVGGGAYGYLTDVGLFGGPRSTKGPAPTVSLPPVGGDVSASDPDGATASYGPARIFENHGPLDVHTQGSPGPSGFATSSADVFNVEDNDPFHAGSPDGQVSSTCRADQSGLSGSTHIVNGYIVVHTDPTTGDPAEILTFDHDYDPEIGRAHV